MNGTRLTLDINADEKLALELQERIEYLCNDLGIHINRAEIDFPDGCSLVSNYEKVNED